MNRSMIGLFFYTKTEKEQKLAIPVHVKNPDILAMMYDSPILVWLGECDRHPEKEEEGMKALELQVRLFYKTFHREKN